MSELVRVRSVAPLEGFCARIEFTDGTVKEIDLEPYLHGPIFEPLRTDPSLFRSMTVDSRGRTICWPNGADIDPDVLFQDLTPAWREPVAGRTLA
jgi:hypothetical protein